MSVVREMRRSETARSCGLTLGSARVFAIISVAIAPIVLQSPALGTTTASRNPFGHYQESVTDMSIKVLGGFVSVEREWRGHVKQWVFLPNWQDLAFGALGADGMPATIQRGEVIFKRQNGGAVPLWVRTAVADRITWANNIYRWQNIDGDWIEFDADGRMTTFGDRNITMATAVRDGQGRITGLRDHNDFPVLTFEYTGSNLTRAHDYTNREVLYAYNGTDLVTVTDVRGNPWGYTYSGGNLSTKTDAEARVTTITYAADGTLKSIRDEDGFGSDHRYAYDSSRRQYYTYVRRSGNVVTETWTDEEGELVRRDLNGRTILKVRRDGSDRIHTDENSNKARVRYDALRRVIGVIYPDGSTMTREVTIFDSPDAVVNENGVRTEFEHDSRGNVTRITEAVGLPEERVTEQTFNALGQLTERREVVDQAAGDRVTTFDEYDDFGNLSETTDAEGNVTEREHDVLGNVTTLIDARGKTWSYTFDEDGNPVGTRDPLLEETSTVFDNVGNVVSVTDEEDGVTSYTYDTRNRVIAQTDALGNLWRYEHTEAGLLKRTIDPEGHAMAYQYDRDGRVTAVIDGNGNVTATAYIPGNTPENPEPGRLERITFPTFTRERQYDMRNRLIAETDIGNGGMRLTTGYAYDGVGNRVSTTNPDGRVTAVTYDTLNRLVSRRLTDNRVVQIERDTWGQLVKITDPRLQTTELTFDKVGRRLSEKKPGGGITTFVYDEAGNLTRIIDPRDQIVESEYDDAGRLAVERTFPSSSVSSPTQVTTYSYNGRGDLVGYNDGSHSATHIVDALGRVTSASVDFGPFTKGHQYAYYGNGQVRSFTGPDGVTYEYGYDGNNQVRSVEIPGEGQIVYSSYRWSSPTRIVLPGGTVQEYEHDDFLRVTHISSKDPAGNVILDHQYTWNQMGQVTHKFTEHGAYHYQYSDGYQVTIAESPFVGEESFTHDSAANRLPGDSNVASQWHYSADSELVSTDVANYFYDDAGNRISQVTSEDTLVFAYDERSQLLRVERDQGGVIARYGYDPLRRRIWKEAGDERTYFYHTRDGLAAELNSDGEVLRSFGYIPNEQFATALLPVLHLANRKQSRFVLALKEPYQTPPIFLRDTSIHYYHNDHLSTPQRLTDSAGRVSWAGLYSAYGACHSTVSAVSNPLRFPGQYQDDETGLLHNWHRQYDPQTGSYLTPDPYRGSVLMMDPSYVYALGDPINLIDPTGLRATCPPCPKVDGMTLTNEWEEYILPIDPPPPARNCLDEQSVPNPTPQPPPIHLGKLKFCDYRGPDGKTRLLVRECFSSGRA